MHKIVTINTNLSIYPSIPLAPYFQLFERFVHRSQYGKFH